MRNESQNTGAVPYISSSPQHVRWGTLPLRDDAAIATLDSGDLVDIDTVSHEGLLEDQGSDPLAFFGAQGVPADLVLTDAIEIVKQVNHPQGFGPHVITGPIAVRGAEPGDYLAVDIVRLCPRVPYGIISNRHGRGVLPELPRYGGAVSIFARQFRQGDRLLGQIDLRGTDAISSYEHDIAGKRSIHRVDWDEDDQGSHHDAGVVTFPLSPFLGIVGVTPSSSTRLSTVPPSDFGGNIDINLLVEGTRIYIPVFVPGAGFYIGDPHFSQGNGEVALTAFEASLSARVRLTIIPHDEFVGKYGHVAGPLLETESCIVPTGRGASLDEALRNCARESIGVLVARYGMDEAHAYAYLSACVDFDISEAVDIQQGVHACIRKSDFA